MTDDNLARLLTMIDANPPANPDAVLAAEAELGRTLPSHYRRFLNAADGCEGVLGNGYVALWPVGDLADLNTAYSVDEFVPGLLFVGSNGGETAYALDLRREGAPVVALPFIPMEDELIEYIGDSVVNLLRTIEAL